MAIVGELGILCRSHSAVSFIFLDIDVSRFIELFLFVSHNTYPDGEYISALLHLLRESFKVQEPGRILLCGDDDMRLGQVLQCLVDSLHITLREVMMVGECERAHVLNELPDVLLHLTRVADAGQEEYVGVVFPQRLGFEHAVAPELMHGFVGERAEEELLIRPDVQGREDARSVE